MVYSFPSEIQTIREKAVSALGDLQPAGSPQSDDEPKGLMLSSRTKCSRNLPPYYLIYFLLVDLLEFPYMGKWEKSAWTVPVRFRGRLYGIEHRKSGVGIFAPNLDPQAFMSGVPTDTQEADALEILELITKSVVVAKEYFKWCAEQSVASSKLNVINKSKYLFSRYEFFRNQFRNLQDKIETRKNGSRSNVNEVEDAQAISKASLATYNLRYELEWNGQAAIEAFFSWTEHIFIHLAILQGKVVTGVEVADLAKADWGSKFKVALDLDDKTTKVYYDSLLDLRAQIRNFLAHGSFGKRGEAFFYHSGAGAVPVLLSENQDSRYSYTGNPAFNERKALIAIEGFIDFLWGGSLRPAKHHIFSELPSILSFSEDGTYANAMVSEELMMELVDRITMEFDISANMDW